MPKVVLQPLRTLEPSRMLSSTAGKARPNWVQTDGYVEQQTSSSLRL